jgi:HD-GYP domain-containing protein (c-di-GMP phosphodiesterase class II)
MLLLTSGGAGHTRGCGAKPGGCSGKCGGLGDCAMNTAHQLAESLGRAVDARDQRLSQHSELVAEISGLLARAHGLTARQVELVHLAGHLHDIGKIGVPDAVLHKPGPLTPEEWLLVREHPRLGAEILCPVRVFQGAHSVCEMVLSHHERFDGGGYPRGLANRDIPLGARLVCVADAFCAMTEDRPYRRGMCVDEAVREIEASAGTMFDPCVVKDFLRIRGLLPELMQGGSGLTCALP